MTDTTTELLAAPRDASSIDRPNIRSRKKAHVAINVVALADTWWQQGDMHGEAACAPARIVLDMSLSGPASIFPEHVRCRRAGCAARWPDFAEDRR